MDDAIIISWINDYIFCPISIYYHQLMAETDTMLYYSNSQINGKNAHKTIDEERYSSRKDILSGISIYSEEYNLIGKIDIYNKSEKILIERKKKIKSIYDGYVLQLYAQYFALMEMGYEVRMIKLHSLDDNKTYNVKMPEDDPEMKELFFVTIKGIRELDIIRYKQTNVDKCKNCIYQHACDRSLYDIST